MSAAVMALGVLGTATPASAARSDSAHSIPGRSNGTGLTVQCLSQNGFACAGAGYNGTRAQIGEGWSPTRYWDYGSTTDGGATRHNCTTYSAYRLQKNGYGDPGWPGGTGDATNWDYNAEVRSGIPVDQNPVVGSIAQWNGSTYGHVAYVEVVTADYIEVTGDNYGVNYTARHRIQRSSPYMPDNFIHFKDQPSGPAAGSPVGHVDGALGLLGGGAWLRGWVLDPNTPAPTAIHVYVDGQAGSGARGVALPNAEQSRPDVGAAYPGLGDHHGYSTGITGLSAGAHTLYVYGINVGGTAGENALLQQVQVSVPASAAGTPIGTGDSAVGAIGAIETVGWAFDPDQPTGAVTIHAYLDGPAGTEYQGASLGTATRTRTDVAAAYPQAGPAHGFDAFMLDVAPGPHSLFVYAVNLAGGGDNPLLGILNVTVPSGSPTGSFDAATDGQGAIRLRGWSIDPDDPKNPVTVHAYLDGPTGTGTGRDLGPASVARSDVATVHPGAGPNHGFDATFPSVSVGTHTVYLYALDRKAPGQNVLLGQRTVSVTAAPVAPPPTSPPPTSPPPTPPPTTPPGGTTPTTPDAPTATAAVRAVKGASKLYVDVNPDKAGGYWRFRVQRKTSTGAWKSLSKYKTYGKRETRTLNLAKGTYRVIVLAKYGHLGSTSAEVYLKR